jgi:hypothetical protein
MFLHFFFNFALAIHRRNFCEPVLIQEESTWIIINKRKRYINQLRTEKKKIFALQLAKIAFTLCHLAFKLFLLQCFFHSQRACLYKLNSFRAATLKHFKKVIQWFVLHDLWHFPQYLAHDCESTSQLSAVFFVSNPWFISSYSTVVFRCPHKFIFVLWHPSVYFSAKSVNVKILTCCFLVDIFTGM